MIGLPDSSRHSTILRPSRRSEIGFSPRKCEGQIGYQMFRTPLASSVLIDWLVTAVIVASPYAPSRFISRWNSSTLHGWPFGAGTGDLVEARHQAGEVVDAGGVGALDRVAQQVLVVVRLAVARLVRVEIGRLLLHHLPPLRTRSLMRSRTGMKSYAG